MGVPVIDPLRAAEDPGMPFLREALEPAGIGDLFTRRLDRLAGGSGRIDPIAVRVVRHKAGRRCLIEYDVVVDRPGVPPETLTLIGKVRAKGLDRSGFRLLEDLRKAGFGEDSEDGVSIPEPIGVVPEFRMWVQRKAPGVSAARRLAEPEGAALAVRIAEAIHKVHRAGIAPLRRHAMADELAILRVRIADAARAHPRLAGRMGRVLEACVRLGASVAAPEPRGIHRDFYPDQVLVDGDRLYLLDFDLFCEGDPALDAGNFAGHLTEQALRTLGDPGALDDRETAFEERFMELAGLRSPAGVRAYAALTLARHISISTQIPERRSLTEPLLALCEERLGAAGAPTARPTR